MTKLRAVFLNPYRIMAPPLSVIKIVKYCGVFRQNPTKDNSAPPPLISVIKIVKYCGVGGGRQNPTQDNALPPLCH